MKLKLPHNAGLDRRLNDLRHVTAGSEALMQLSILGLIVGLSTACLLIIFIFLLESSLAYWLPNQSTEDFESLSISSRLLAPIVGSLILVIVFKFITRGPVSVGVVDILDKVRYHEAVVPLKNLIVQFIGAFVALLSGHSMGREGPSIHMGAALGSLLSQFLKLPNNSTRTLLACGSAAAIGAAFNTPLAGVIFAMEVIVVEYTFASFIPIIIAAVTATAITQLAYGHFSLVEIDAMPAIAVSEIPYLILLGVLVGCASTVFTYLVKIIAQRTHNLDLSIRFLLAGAITGAVAVFIPEVMGTGYDTITAAILGELSLIALLSIMIFKLITTVFAVGCGIPAGLISPTLVIGAVGGAFMAAFLHHSLDLPIQNTGIYAIIGMSAMMGACLQAPLAALTAVFEITTHHNIIWPSMLSIVVAQLVSRQLFKQPPVFDLLLNLRGLSYQHDPLVQSLQRTGVSNIMNEDFVCLSKVATRHTINHIQIPDWIVIEDDKHNPIAILTGQELTAYLDENPQQEAVDLTEIPASNAKIACIDVRSTTAKAYEIFQQQRPDILCVTHWNQMTSTYILGVISRQHFNQSIY